MIKSGYLRAVSQVVSNQLNIAVSGTVLPKKQVVQVPFQGSTVLSLSRALPNANFSVSSGPAVTSQIRYNI